MCACMYEKPAKQQNIRPTMTPAQKLAQKIGKETEKEKKTSNSVTRFP